MIKFYRTQTTTGSKVFLTTVEQRSYLHHLYSHPLDSVLLSHLTAPSRPCNDSIHVTAAR